MNLIKVVFVLASICLVSLWSRAENPHHNHPNPPPGPVGPPGPAGQSIVGPAGTNGSDAQQDRLNVYLGAGIRLYDAKRWSASTYVNQDIWHGGTVVGGLIMFKLGPSAEEREIQALRAELKAMSGYAKAPTESEKPIQAKIRGSK